MCSCSASSPSAPASVSVDNGLMLSTLFFYSISSDLYVVSRLLYLLAICLMRIWLEYILPQRLLLYLLYNDHLPVFSESL